MDLDDELDRMKVWAKKAFDDDTPAVVAELLSVYVEHRPSDEYAWFLLGEALRELGRFVDAEPILLRILPDAPPDRRLSVLASLGRLKGEHGCLDEAEEWFEQATADEFGCSEGWIWIMRGGNLAVAGRFDEAIFCHRQATELPGNPEEAYLNIGNVFRAQGKYAEAIKAFQKALELTPDYPEAVLALAGLTEIFSAVDFASSVASDDLQ